MNISAVARHCRELGIRGALSLRTQRKEAQRLKEEIAEHERNIKRIRASLLEAEGSAFSELLEKLREEERLYKKCSPDSFAKYSKGMHKKRDEAITEKIAERYLGNRNLVVSDFVSK